MRNEENAYQSWLWGEVLLFGLLGATLALFVAYPDLRPTFELPQVRLVLDTMVALAAGLLPVAPRGPVSPGGPPPRPPPSPRLSPPGRGPLLLLGPPGFRRPPPPP